eukprot:1091932-Amphidinium_carterae.1
MDIGNSAPPATHLSRYHWMINHLQLGRFEPGRSSRKEKTLLPLLRAARALHDALPTSAPVQWWNLMEELITYGMVLCH